MPAPHIPRHDRAARRAILAAAQTPDLSDADLARALDELRRLAEGLDIEVIDTLVQRRDSDRATHLFGKGRLAELKARFGAVADAEAPDAAPADEPRPDLLLVNNEISPGQQFALEKAIGATVMDRTAIILEVFDARARTHIARLELEIAWLDYAVPRMRDLEEPDREGGGGRGERGHTQAELRRQQARIRRAALRKQLVAARAADDRARARRQDMPVAAIVGYTNAGKSSLMRALTGEAVYVADQLFATLGSTVRAIEPPTDPKVLVVDTVGFIENLPHALVASFRSTLEEARLATLLLFVVDASDPLRAQQLAVSQETVSELVEGELAPSMLIFNKIDRLDADARAALAAEHPDAIQISALEPADVARLRGIIEAHMRAGQQRLWLRVPYSRGHLVGAVHEGARVRSEAYDASGTLFEVDVEAAELGRLEKLGVERAEAPEG